MTAWKIPIRFPQVVQFASFQNPLFFYRSAHTVCGHEALHLAKCLTEELANQATQSSGRSFGNRSVSPEPEPRARSYDQKSPQKGKGKFFFELLSEYVCYVT